MPGNACSINSTVAACGHHFYARVKTLLLDAFPVLGGFRFLRAQVREEGLLYTRHRPTIWRQRTDGARRPLVLERDEAAARARLPNTRRADLAIICDSPPSLSDKFDPAIPGFPRREDEIHRFEQSRENRFMRIAAAIHFPGIVGEQADERAAHRLRREGVGL